ncbi:NmrA-like protein [Macrophomina phaseolina MS6]|uniref:NmrA-like protein n=1 Tax=Macrophomina phaseolina (strain MS6) TaxID=1126212 RepID=K2QP87_MACPH|nr:NmrA-like protein [Macrophomina phaseolina MS6]
MFHGSETDVGFRRSLRISSAKNSSCLAVRLSLESSFMILQMKSLPTGTNSLPSAIEIVSLPSVLSTRLMISVGILSLSASAISE